MKQVVIGLQYARCHSHLQLHDSPVINPGQPGMSTPFTPRSAVPIENLVICGVSGMSLETHRAGDKTWGPIRFPSKVSMSIFTYTETLQLELSFDESANLVATNIPYLILHNGGACPTPTSQL